MNRDGREQKYNTSSEASDSHITALMRSMLQAQGILHFDLTDDKCLTAAGLSDNMSVFQIGSSVDEEMGKITSYMPDKEEQERFLQNFSREELLKKYSSGENCAALVVKTIYDDGGLRYTKISGRLMKNSDTGHLECIVYCMDASDEIKQKQHYENYISEQLSIFNVLAKNFLNIYLVDAKESVLYVLKMEGYVTTGLKNDSSVAYPYWATCQQYIKERVHPDDRAMMLEALKLENVLKMLDEHEDYVGTYRVLVNEEIHTYQFRYTRIEESGRIIAGFQNIDDMIREEKKRRDTIAVALEAAQQSNRAKTQFLNNMSHDIRTPMNAIIGYTALAEQNLDDKEKMQDYLSKIGTASRHLLSLINDVLDMSRIESGRINIEEKPVNLSDVCDDLHVILHSDMAAKNLKFEYEAVNIVNRWVYCDRLRLNQIFLNIVSNAIKFTPPGGTVGFYETQKPNTPSGYAVYEIRIWDTGIGMSQDFLKHIFEPFAREKTATVSGIQGTGLGMAITKNIVDIMGGDIRVSSKEGEGTEFTLTLPFRICEEAKAAKPAVPEKKYKVSFAGKRVLLVDDNALNLEIAKEILTQAGFEVETAHDGDVAVAKLRYMKKGDFDAVLMDIQMPKMDGYTAAREIRTLDNEAAANIPIIAVTADAFQEDKSTAVKAGMNGHIAKPLDPDQLMELLAKILK